MAPFELKSKCNITYKWLKYCRIQTPPQELYDFVKENGIIDEDSWSELVVLNAARTSEWYSYMTVKMWMTYEKPRISNFKKGFVYRMFNAKKDIGTILYMKPVYMNTEHTMINLFRCDERMHKIYDLSDDYYLRVDEHTLSNYVLVETHQDVYKEPSSKRQRSE